MAAAEQPTIACRLSDGDYAQRIASIANLTREALQTHDRNDLVPRLVYRPEAASKVRALVEHERICCAFLTYDLLEHADAVCVTITALEAARTAADTLFRSFLPPNNENQQA